MAAHLLAWLHLHPLLLLLLLHLQDYIAEKEPVTYSCMRYTTIEISPNLAAQQQQLIVQQRGHAQAWHSVQGDAAAAGAWVDVAAALPQQHSLQQHVFVLMMEVLDNLPHDRWEARTHVCKTADVGVTGSDTQQMWAQRQVTQNTCHQAARSCSGCFPRHPSHVSERIKACADQAHVMLVANCADGGALR